MSAVATSNADLAWMSEDWIFAQVDTIPASICLPYKPSVVEMDSFFKAALDTSHHQEVVMEFNTEDKRHTLPVSSSIMLHDFSLGLFAEPALVEVVGTGTFIFWDKHERFAVIGGSSEVCRKISPHSREIMKRYYLEEMEPQGFSSDEMIDCFEKLHNEQ